MSVYKGVLPTQSDLLIMDGHGSLASIELVELVRANVVHLFCLLSHMTHILQPLDVAVSKSLTLRVFSLRSVVDTLKV